MKKLLPTLALSLLATVSAYVSAEVPHSTINGYPNQKISFDDPPSDFFGNEKEYLDQAIANNNDFISNMQASMFARQISSLCHRKETLKHQASIADTIVANRASGEEIDITPDMLAPKHFIDQMLSYNDNTLIDFSNKKKIEILENINSITNLQLFLNQSPMENPC